MSDNPKKYILNLLESEITQKLMNIFEDLFFTVKDSLEEGIDYEYVLIDSLEKEVPSSAKVIFFGQLIDRKAFFEKNGVAIVSNDFITSETELTYFRRLLGENSTLDVSDSFNGELRALGKIKVTDHLNSGFYCDSISVRAAEEGFDFFNIKSGIFNLFNFISEIILSEKADFPLDVEFGISEDNFFIQTHFPINEIENEDIWSSLEKKTSPLSILINTLKTIDIYTLEKSNKLVVTTSWAKERTDRQSLYIHEIDSFRLANRKVNLDKVKPLEVDYKENLNLHIEKSKGSRLSLSSVSKIINFLKLKDNELDTITVENVTEHLKNYPNKALISDLNILDKEKIVNLIKDTVKQKEVEQSIENKKDLFGNDLLNSFLSKVENLHEDEANEIVSLVTDQYSEGHQRVSGWLDQVDDSSVIVEGQNEDLGEDSQLIAGSREDIGEDSILIEGVKEDLGEDSILVKGSKEDIGFNNEKTVVHGSQELPKWAMAKELLVSELKKKVANNEIKSSEDLESIFSNILKEQMNISDEESIALSSGILNDSVVDTLDRKYEEPDELVGLKDESIKKNIQISRMMKLIDVMKKELLLKSKGDVDPAYSLKDMEISRLKNELEHKSKQVETLMVNTEGRENIGNINSDLVSPPDNFEIIKYKEKTKNLEKMLEDSKEKIELLNTKLEDEKESSIMRSDNETVSFREKIIKNQSIVNKIQKENRDLQEQVNGLKKLRDELSVAVAKNASREESPDSLSEKSKEVEGLALVLKKEKDQSKALILKVKQLEQKNKFLLAQVDDKTKGSSGIKGPGKSSIDPKSQHKIKQLEKLSNSFKLEAENSKSELADKKKEILKFKQESNVLKLKVQEYERKLAIKKNNAA